VRAFGATLDATFGVVLRKAEVGFGFSWGRHGPRTVIRRAGELPIFADRRRAGFWERMLGR
jgi:hypothetical protein